MSERASCLYIDYVRHVDIFEDEVDSVLLKVPNSYNRFQLLCHDEQVNKVKKVVVVSNSSMSRARLDLSYKKGKWSASDTPQAPAAAGFAMKHSLQDPTGHKYPWTVSH